MIHRRYAPLREQGALVAVGIGFALSILISTRLSGHWSWIYLIAGIGLIAGTMLYLARPGVFIALALVPFAFLDENTPDAIPQFGALTDNLFAERDGGLLAPRDIILALAAVAAAAWFPATPERNRRVFGRVTWVVIAAAGCIFADMIVGLYVLHAPGSSIKALRPFYTCVLTAFIVWRVLRSMPMPRAERLLLRASVVVGTGIIAIAIARVGGLAGTAVEISGVPITFYDAASPFLLLACIGVWTVAINDRVVSGLARILLMVGVFAGVLVAIASQRRAVLIGYVVAALLLLVVNAVRKPGGLGRSLRILAAVVGVVVFALVSVSIVVPGARQLLAERAQEALQAGSAKSSADTSLQFRVEESDAAYALVGRELWIGIGPAAGFTPVNGIFLPTDGRYIHNTYLALPLRYGIWGILALGVLVLGFVLRVSRGLFRDPPRQAWIYGAAPIALLPAIATAGFLTQTVRWGIILGALIGAFDALTEPDIETPAETLTP